MTLDGTEKLKDETASMEVTETAAGQFQRLFIENPTGLKATLLSQTGKMQSLFLPYPAKGSLCFPKEPVEHVPIHFEAETEKWVSVRENTARYLSAENPFEKKQKLLNQELILIRNGESLFMLYTEEVNEASFIRHNYVALPGDLYIGRNEENDLVYSAPMISGRHARLHYNGTTWSIHDLDSTNGIYVNGYRVKSMKLDLGDVIDIFGLQIIVGSRFLSINDGNHRVAISPKKARFVDDTNSVMSNVFPEKRKNSEMLFNRYPRKRLAFEDKTIEIDSPPMPMGKDGIPLIMRMGSSMIMGSTAALTGNVTMLASSILLPLLSKGYTKEQKEEYEERRLEKYREYLSQKQEEILQEKEREESVLRQNYPELSKVLGYVYEKKKLWSRTNSDDDFLDVRIGSGNIPLKAKISCPGEHFDMEEDVLKDELNELTETQVMLEQVPIMIPLLENRVLGIQGRLRDVTGFINTLVLQLTILFSYDEVKLVFLMEESQLDDMAYIKYLPHVWDDQRSIRLIATNASEAYQVGEYLLKELEKDLESQRKWEQIRSERPYYLVIALSKKLLDGVEVIKQVIQKKESIGLSLITGFPDVPKECSVILELNKETEQGIRNKLIYVRELDKEDETFLVDDFEEKEALESMRVLANTRLRLVSQAYALPKTVTFLEMFGVGRIEDLNIAERWKNHDPVTSLAVPVGIGTDGAEFLLDLHQKYQGPHGLVAGTTGSGKSEFLLTYVLSLAVNFHPDEVAFLLIDYKGGGLAGAFDDPQNQIRLPHLIGTITNLDGAAINRSLISIQSEVLRRQKVFNDAKSRAGEGTMDIYTYQRLYRNGTVSEPMPHLFIISDEFAELKQQQPDFLDQLVSIARIGRSLGVHLILATQKPAGVVTDQILSNTKFRVCLKVQDRADSMDMLKRPEAAEIRETGRFYLQVGNNEYFAMGQSAWSGAEYEPQDEVVKQKDESIQVIDHVGSPVMTVKPEIIKNSTGKSQLVSLVKSIMEIAREQKISSKALWLPMLPDKLPVEKEEERPEELLKTTIGLLDDPARQEQYPLYLDLETCGHILVCGEPGSGKTSFVEALLYSLVKKTTPEQFQFYIMDYSSRLLKVFRNLPHCGAVLEEDDAEQSTELFRLINGIIQERKKLFSALEVSSYSDAVKRQPLPFILIVIDNVAGFLQTKAGQKQYDQLQYDLKNSVNYGVSYLFTIGHVNEINMRTRQELKARIALRLKDKYDYTDILGVKCTCLPPEKPGRGLFSHRGEALEMQLARFAPELDQEERIQKLKEEVNDLAGRNQKYQAAKKLAKIQVDQEYEDFLAGFAGSRFPLGYEVKTSRPIALPLKQFNQLSLYFSDKMAAVPILKNLVTYAKAENMVVAFLKEAKESCYEELGMAEDARIFTADREGIEQLAAFLCANAQHRYNLYTQYCEEHHWNPETAVAKQEVFSHMRESFRPILVLFERYSDLLSVTMEISGYLAKFSSVYVLARYAQIYLMAGFYSDEPPYLWGNELYKCFNTGKMTLLFGEKLNKQSLVQLPYDMERLLSKKGGNHFIMSYRGELHHLIMPCGELRKETVKTDDDSIFEDG